MAHPVGRGATLRASGRAIGRRRAAKASGGRSTTLGKSFAARRKAFGQAKKRRGTTSTSGTLTTKKRQNKKALKSLSTKLTAAGRGGRPAARGRFSAQLQSRSPRRRGSTGTR